MFVRKLQVDTAYHSHHMDLVAEDYSEVLRELEPPTPSNIRFYSSLLGRIATSQELDATYWVQNLTCAVRFDEAMQSMCQPVGEFKTGVNFLCELGPHAALQGPINQILKHIGGAALKIPYTSVLSRKQDAVHTALTMAGALFVKGAVLSMDLINFPIPLERAPQVLVDMPRYSWNHTSKFYHESRFTKIHKFHDAPKNDIIGVLASYSNDAEPTWRNMVRLDDLPWLRHYQIQGVTIFPIAGFLAMAIEAIAQRAISTSVEWNNVEVDNLIVKNSVMLTEEELEMTVTLRRIEGQTESDESQFFVIRSWSQNRGWTENCTGNIALVNTNNNEVDGQRSQKLIRQSLYSKKVDIAQAATECVSIRHMYAQLAEIGVTYGSSFQGLQNCYTSSQGSVAEIIKINTELEMPYHQETDYIIHPTSIEQLISMYWPVIASTGPLSTIHLPSSIGKVTISSRVLQNLQAPGASLQAVCEPTKATVDSRSNKFSMFAVDSVGEAVVTIEDLSLAPILEIKACSHSDKPDELCYKLNWEPIPDSHDMNSRRNIRSTFDVEIVIIRGETELQHTIASSLAKQLADTSAVKITQGTVETTAHIAKNRLCVVLTELDSPLLATLTASQFEALQVILKSAQGVLWMVHGAYYGSKNPDVNMVSGLSRTLRSEGTLTNFVTLDFDGQEDLELLKVVSNISRVLQMTLGAQSKHKEMEFWAKDGKLFTPRIIDDNELNNYVHEQVHPAATEPARFCDIKRPLRGSITVPGAVNSLVFDDDDCLQYPISDNYVEVQIKAVGVNAADLASSSAIGLECSGIVTTIGLNVPNLQVGDRVAAITIGGGSLSTLVRVHSSFVYKIPEHLSFESSATMPIAYCTAVYALLDQARLSDGENILIHNAASPVGQAALTIAQIAGACVWATVKTEDEKLFIMRQFSIPQDRVWFAGATYFADRIQSVTQGIGVDVVFGTPIEQRIIHATWECLSRFGRFISVGSEQFIAAKMPQGKHATIFSADIVALAESCPQAVRRVLANVAKMSRYGQIQPFRRIRSFGPSEILVALQLVSAADATDKAVVVLRDDDCVAAPRIKNNISILRSDATYILIGGTGGLGRSMAKWMVNKGAKHIVLLSRSGTLKGQAAEQIAALNNAGANIVVRCCDVASKVDVDNLILRGLTDLPPVRGVIHGAMVLHDVLFERMTYAQYTSVISSKVQGAWNFHRALSSTSMALEFFIVISSAAGAVGNRGQAAYAAANTFLNGFAQHLLAQGIRSASLDLTAISDAGYLTEDADKAAEVARNLGSDTICLAQVLALVQAAMEGKLTSCNGHPITGMRITPTNRPFWSTDPKFVHLLAAAETASLSSSSTTMTAAVIPWSIRFRTAASRADAESVVCAALVEKISEVLSMEAEELDVERSLGCYPLDSLTAIEVRNFITRMFESNLQVLELLASGSIKSLASVVARKTKIKLPEA